MAKRFTCGLPKVGLSTRIRAVWMIETKTNNNNGDPLRKMMTMTIAVTTTIIRVCRTTDAARAGLFLFLYYPRSSFTPRSSRRVFVVGAEKQPINSCPPPPRARASSCCSCRYARAPWCAGQHDEQQLASGSTTLIVNKSRPLVLLRQ